MNNKLYYEEIFNLNGVRYICNIELNIVSKISVDDIFKEIRRNLKIKSNSVPDCYFYESRNCLSCLCCLISCGCYPGCPHGCFD